MSATASTLYGEMAPPAPVFSYAQAAKSQSSALTTNNTSSKPSSDSTEDTSKDSSVLQCANAAEEAKPNETLPIKATQEDMQSKKDSSSENDNPIATDSEAFSSKLGTNSSSRATTSTPSSPLLDTGSDPTVRKEDDVFTTTNELEATWDKVSQASQASQNDDKSSSKMEGDGDDSKLSSWEHLPPSSQLRDAPPPLFNIWEKRAMDAQAKSKDPKQASLNSSAQKTEPASMHNIKKADFASDISKHDKRKTRTGPQVMDEKNGSTGYKDGIRVGEGKSRGTDDGKLRSYCIILKRGG